MSNAFENLKKLLNSVEVISQLRTIDRAFTFKESGWYLFVSPISGVIKIKIIRNNHKDFDENNDVERFINFKLIGVLELEDDRDYYEMFRYIADGINELNELQRHIIKLIGMSKIQIHKPGYYNLQLTQETVNYVNYWKYKDTKSYYLFNGIESSLLSFYLKNLTENERKFDEYLNDPFYDFMYNLDGFFIHKYRLPQTVVSRLAIGAIYKCIIDYKYSSFSPFNPILTIKYIC